MELGAPTIQDGRVCNQDYPVLDAIEKHLPIRLALAVRREIKCLESEF